MPYSIWNIFMMFIGNGYFPGCINPVMLTGIFWFFRNDEPVLFTGDLNIVADGKPVRPKPVPL